MNSTPFLSGLILQEEQWKCREANPCYFTALPSLSPWAHIRSAWVARKSLAAWASPGDSNLVG